MEPENMISKKNSFLICISAYILLMTPSSSVLYAVQPQPPDDLKTSEYFEKTKSEILDGRKFNDQSTPVDALLTLISAYYHQDKITLEQIFPIVRQKQFEKLSSPEVRTRMLAAAKTSILCKIEIADKPPKESDLCAIYTRQSPEKPIDQVWSFAYVKGAWRFAGSTSSTDNWRTQAEQAESMTRNILLQSEEAETKTEAINTPQQNANKIEGKWQATLTEFNQKYVIRFWRKPDGSLAGAATRNNPDDRPFDTVTFENGKLRFEEKTNQAVFDGTMKEDGLTIEGKLQKPGMITPCVLKRVDEVQIDDKGQNDNGVVQGSEKQIQRQNKLVARWKLDEADGNIVADSSGNACGGKLVGNPQWRPAGGKVGGALEFDGDGDYVRIDNESAFDITGPITIATWFKVNAFDKRWQSLITKGDTSWRIQRYAEEDTLAFHCTGVSSVTGQRPEGIEGKKNVNDGQWHHVAGVYDGSEILLYIDGALDNSSKASGEISMNDWTVIIGGNSEQSGREWNGLIDEVDVISGAIDANAVHALYTGADPEMIAQKANPQLQSTDKLLAWWKFEDNVNDSAGINNGNIHGNPIYVDGKVGRAISFDGDDYVDCGNPDSLNFGTGDWAISVWIKTTQSGVEDTDKGTVFANGADGGGGIRYTLAVNEGQNGSVALTTDDDKYKVQAISSAVVNDGAWHHVVGTRNAEQLHLYVDGVLDGGSYLPDEFDLSDASGQNAYIGAITNNDDNSLYKYYVGSIDEVCIFAGAIDAKGILALYSGEDPVTVAKTMLIRPKAQPRPTSSSNAGAVEGIEGDWQLSTNPAIIQIRRKSDGSLEATAVAESPDTASPAIPLDDVTFEDGTLRFKATSQQAVFKGKMNEDGMTIEGQIQQQGQVTPAVLKRIVATPSEAVPVVQEQPQDSTSGKSNIVVALMLVLVLAGVVGAIVFFLVKSSVR